MSLIHSENVIILRYRTSRQVTGLARQRLIAPCSLGAMENWAMITYRETALLYNNETGNLANKFCVGEVVSHEVAHQWFGNLVTPKWWNDIW